MVSAGLAAGLLGIAALGGAMLPLRSHLSVATAALVLVVPVVAGVALGGFAAGAVGVLAGFLAYDYFFIPPFGTLAVNAPQDWVALGVYVVVMLVVSRVVAALQAARATASLRESDVRQLFEISDLLIGDRGTTELLDSILSTLRRVFGLESAALLLPSDGTLAVASVDGAPLPEAVLARIMPSPPSPVSAIGSEDVQTFALATASRPIGLLVLVGQVLGAHERELVATFANHAALAVERAQLREAATRAAMLEEVDRWRAALVGSVSHDLRTPLAAIKAAVSNLVDPLIRLTADERAELLAMIESETDRMVRLVTSVLDMSRVEAGALEPRCQAVLVEELVDEAVRSATGHLDPARIGVSIDFALPLAAADPVLAGQVLANLIENAACHGSSARHPDILVSARRADGVVELSVADRGPGIPRSMREEAFEAFRRLDSPVPHVSGMGLGLAVAKAFVEAQGGRIRVEDNPGGGAVLTFSLPVAQVPSPIADAAEGQAQLSGSLSQWLADPMAG